MKSLVLQVAGVVLLTSNADSENQFSSLNEHKNAQVKKRFDRVEFKNRINSVMSHRKNLDTKFLEKPAYGKRKKYRPSDADFLSRANKILASKFNDGDFSVNEFCSELALNRNSVNIKLKRLTSQSTAEYIKNYRLDKAVKMLIETEEAILEIYVDCGFNSPQAFNKAFKKRFNCTPSKYRKKALEK